VVGLIGMLSGIGDTTVILSMIPIALTSTLYGIIFSNFFFLPFAAHLRERTDHELLVQKIIMEGVIAIEGEVNPRILERKLKSFLTPAARRREMISIRKIQQRFRSRTAMRLQAIREASSGTASSGTGEKTGRAGRMPTG